MLANGLLGGFAFLSSISGADAADVGLLSQSPKFLLAVLAGSVFGAFLFAVFSFVCKEDTQNNSSKNHSFLTFLISMLLIMAVWILFLFAFYPGLVSYDSYIQIGQIFGGEYNEHHPLFHTLSIKFFYNIGFRLFDSANGGIAFYVLCQAMLLAASFSFMLTVMKERLGIKFYIVFLLVSIFYPYNGFMAVSVTKDIPFTAFMLSALTSMYLVLIGKRRYIIVLFISLVGCILYRNNGKYAILFMAVITFGALILNIITSIRKKVKFDKKYLEILIATVLALIIGVLMLLSCSKLLNATQGDRREMLSVPIQQLSRTYVYHAGVGVKDCDDNTMDSESKALIEEFVLNGGAKLYRADISDPVKSNVNTWVVVNKTKNFVKTYVKLLIKYPADYIKAFFGTNAGYFNPLDKTHMHINEVYLGEGIKPGTAYVQTGWEESYLATMGIVKDWRLTKAGELLTRIADSNILNRTPIVNLLFVPGTFLFVFVNAMLLLFYRKRYGMLIPASMICGYYITLFLGPTVQLRYIYPVMAASLILFIMCFEKTEEKKIEN